MLLQRCVALKIIVANRPLKHHFKTSKTERLMPSTENSPVVTTSFSITPGDDCLFAFLYILLSSKVHFSFEMPETKNVYSIRYVTRSSTETKQANQLIHGTITWK